MSWALPVLHEGQGPTTHTHLSVPWVHCNSGNSSAIRDAISKENIVGFETWAIIFMFNTQIWEMELDQKCILNVLHLVSQLPANHTICLGFIIQNLTWGSERQNT